MPVIEAVTLRELVDYRLPKKIHKRSKNCIVHAVDYQVKNHDRLVLWVECNESYSDPDGHFVTFVFENYVPQKRDTLKPLVADIRLNCSCPAFTFWGSAFQSTVRDYNFEVNESRFPIIRDPKLENKVCKHITLASKKLHNRTFKQLKKRYGDIRYLRSSMLPEEDIHTVSIDHILPSIEKYMIKNGLDKSMDINEVLLSITKQNFEDVMESIKAII